MVGRVVKVNKQKGWNLRKHATDLIDQGVLSVITVEVQSWVPVDGLVLGDLATGAVGVDKLIISGGNAET